MKKEISDAKEELKHIRSLKEILSDFGSKKEGENNGGNSPQNK